MRMIKPILTLSAALLLLHGPSARATSNLRPELAEAAKSIKKLLDGRGESDIAVGAFTGSSRIDSSAGPGIALVLGEELQKAGVGVRRRANLEVKGDYLDVEDKKTKLLAALLKMRVLDRQGTVLVEFERGVFGDATLPALFGLTVQLPPQGDEKARSKSMREGIDKPQTQIASTRISAGPGSPYAIEVLVKEGDKFVPRPPKEEDGFAFVPIKRGEIYAVRLINDSAHEAAVTLSVDGLNMFAFCPDKDDKGVPKYTQVLLDPKKTGLIKGWFLTDNATDSFLVTEYAKSAAEELKSTANLGTITASFCAAWPQDGEPPADEPKKNTNEYARSADATGRGPRVEEKYTEVERHFGVIRASVSVRYTK